MGQEINNYRELGSRLAYAMCGLDPDEMDAHKSATECAAADPIVKKVVCKMAASMYEAAGKTDCPEFFVFRKLASSEDWHAPLDPYYNAVLSGLGAVMLRTSHNTAVGEKRAAARGLAGLLPGLAAKGLAVTPSMLTALAGLGVGAGAGAGAVAWRLNRDTNKDEAKLEALKERIKYYNEITDEISQDLADNGGIEEADLEKYEQQPD